MARVKNSKNKYVSKGERRSSMPTADKTAASRIINQQKAHNAGKRVIVTIENPDKQQTNKRFIRVISSAVWATPKERRLVF